jgi:hypothetical protein
MIVRDATRFDLLDVANHMRPNDWREIFATRWDDDPEALVQDILANRKLFIALKALCLREWRPVAIVGACWRGPAVAAVVMFATEEFPQIALSATRWVRQVGLPLIVDPLVRRTQCECWTENAVSRAWLKTLGYAEEGTLVAYGKNGEGFVVYARLRSGSQLAHAAAGRTGSSPA